MQTSDMDLFTNLKCLFKGKPFTGKTRAVGSFPGPILICDFDGKAKVIRKDYPERTDITVEKYSAENYPSFERRWEGLQEGCRYETVVIDSLTNLSNTLIRYSMNVRGVDRNKDARTGEAKERKRGVIDLPEIEEYGVETSALQNIIDIGMVIPCHFILTAHVLEISLGKNLQGKDMGTTRNLLTAGKKIAAQIPSRFEEMYLFESDTGFDDDEISYWIRTKSTGLDAAGTLLPLPDKIVLTDKGLFTQIVEILKEKGIEYKEPKKEEVTGESTL